MIDTGGETVGYCVAIGFLKELHEKSFNNIEICKLFGDWLKEGGTLRLKEVLKFSSYKESNLVHFNAFSLLDTVKACNSVVTFKSKM